MAANVPHTKRTAENRTYADAETKAMIFHGASIAQLSELFGMRELEIGKRLSNLAPFGTGRQGNPLYRVADAARYLVKIEITPAMIDRYMKSVNPKDLPPATNKMYWDAQMAARKYGEIVGELWHSQDVAAVARTAFQALRMSLLMLPDVLMNRGGLTDDQFKIVQDTVDTALEEARERLVTDLRKPSDEEAIEVSGTEDEL